MLSNVVVFDFETSGLNPQKDRVIELAAVKVVNGQIVSEFSTIVKQDIPGGLTPKITDITGITNDDIKSGMNERTAFKFLNYMMGDSLLVAHNAAFDLAYLHFTLMHLAGRSFSNSFIDTLTISRDRHVYPHKLEDMCKRYSVKLDGAHRALNDVRACWDLLYQMHWEKPVDHYVNKLGYLSKYGPPDWAPEHAILEATENRYDNSKKGA